MPQQKRVLFDVPGFLYGTTPGRLLYAWAGPGFFLQIKIYYILCSSA